MATLREQIVKLNEQVDRVKEAMVDDGMPPICILFADKVMRPAMELTLRAQSDKIPIGDIDEAMVAGISSILFDYLQRVHPKKGRTEVIGHLNLIGQDITERIMEQIDLHFVPEIIMPTKH